jgi:hypothetical protein
MLMTWAWYAFLRLPVAVGRGPLADQIPQDGASATVLAALPNISSASLEQPTITPRYRV